MYAKTAARNLLHIALGLLQFLSFALMLVVGLKKEIRPGTQGQRLDTTTAQYAASQRQKTANSNSQNVLLAIIRNGHCIRFTTPALDVESLRMDAAEVIGFSVIVVPHIINIAV